MINPLWAVAAVALLGTASAAAVYIGTSGGGKQEVVQQVETATPSTSPSRTAKLVLPSPTLSSTLTYTDPTYRIMAKSAGVLRCLRF